MRRLPLSDTLFQFTIFQQNQSDVLIHEFLEKNVSGKINYNSDQFLIRTSFGYTSTQGVCTLGYQLNILGWNKLKMIEQDPYSEVFRTNNHHLMNLMYSVSRVWLGSYIQFPHSFSYNDKNLFVSEEVFSELREDYYAS